VTFYPSSLQFDDDTRLHMVFTYLTSASVDNLVYIITDKVSTGSLSVHKEYYLSTSSYGMVVAMKESKYDHFYVGGFIINTATDRYWIIYKFNQGYVSNSQIGGLIPNSVINYSFLSMMHNSGKIVSMMRMQTTATPSYLTILTSFDENCNNIEL
jgi:hypothetical protein